jgi:hypothetical protein
MPDIKATDILIGPLKIYVAALGTTLPSDTLAEDAAWPSGWTQVAFTKEPLTLASEFESLDIEVEEAMSPIHRRKMKESCTFETVLAEFTTQNLAYALDGTHTATTAPTTTTEGVETFTLGGNRFLTERMWGFEGKFHNRDGTVALPVRLYIWRGSAESGGELEFSKSDYAGIPLKIMALADTSKTVGQHLFKIVRVLPETDIV